MNKCICNDCIHNDVCRDEGYLDPAMTLCGDKISTATLHLFSPRLRLSDLQPHLLSNYFTVIKKTGETCNPCTYTYPEKFAVVGIIYDTDEEKICISVEEI